MAITYELLLCASMSSANGQRICPTDPMADHSRDHWPMLSNNTFYSRSDFGQTNRITFEDINAGSPLVRRSGPEDVSHMWTGNYFQGSAAHPGLEREFEVLSSPDVEPVVISAEFLEELSVDREETAGHSRRPKQSTEAKREEKFYKLRAKGEINRELCETQRLVFADAIVSEDKTFRL